MALTTLDDDAAVVDVEVEDVEELVEPPVEPLVADEVDEPAGGT
jgi:hypothetical protein